MIFSMLWKVALPIELGAAGFATRFQAAAADQRTQVDDNLGATVTSSYDKLDRLVSRTFTQAGVSLTVVQTWTKRDELESVTRKLGTATKSSSQYVYDDKGRIRIFGDMSGINRHGMLIRTVWIFGSGSSTRGTE
jgi:YD repeat-containing protein